MTGVLRPCLGVKMTAFLYSYFNCAVYNCATDDSGNYNLRSWDIWFVSISSTCFREAGLLGEDNALEG